MLWTVISVTADGGQSSAATPMPQAARDMGGTQDMGKETWEATLTLPRLHGHGGPHTM